MQKQVEDTFFGKNTSAICRNSLIVLDEDKNYNKIFFFRINILLDFFLFIMCKSACELLHIINRNKIYTSFKSYGANVRHT